jgi:hypothetical protein
VEGPRIAPKRAQVCRLAPDWKAYRPLLMGTGTASGEALPNTWSNRGDSLYTLRGWEAKMEIPVYMPWAGRPNLGTVQLARAGYN